MRVAFFLSIVGMGLSIQAAQSQIPGTSKSAIIYWEEQRQTLLRDTTLIRLYTREADSISDLDSSLAWLQKGFAISLRLRSNPWLAYSHNQVGLLYLRKGLSFKAIEYLYKGLQYAEMSRDAEKQAFSWHYIAECYANLKNYGKAIQAEMKAITFYEASNNLPGLAQALNNLGGSYRENNLLEKSIEALEQSLSTGKAVQNPAILTATYFNLAATYLKMEDFKSAEKFGILAMENEINHKGRASAELFSLLSLIKSRTNDTGEALNYAERAGFYLLYEWPIVREKTAYNLYLTYKALQLPDTALQWHEKYLVLRERNYAEAQKKRIEVLRYEYEAQQRDAQIKLMVEDMEQQNLLRNVLLFCLFVFFILAFALYRGNYLLRKKRRELDATNLQLLEMGQLLRNTNATLEERVEDRTRELTELNHTLTLKNNEIQEALFRGQSIERKRVASELHNNLGSLLSGVKWRLESIDLDSLPPSEQGFYHSVVKLITDAYHQVRHISHNLLPSVLEKEGLIPALDKLIGDLNRSGKASFELIYAQDAQRIDKKISFELYSCALELINNILKHACARQIVIEFVQTESFYILMVTDDGVGIIRDKAMQTGTGLENIRQRVKSLQGSFSIYSLKKNTGTLVTLRIPRPSTLVP